MSSARSIAAWRSAREEATASTSSSRVGRQAGRRRSSRQPDDRFLEIGPGPGRADAAAGAARRAPDGGRGGSRHGRRRCAARARRTSRWSHADFLDVRPRRAGSRRRPAAGRRQPALQRLLPDPVPAARRAPARGAPDRRCHADAAAGGRRADRGGARDARTTACCRSSCSCTPTCGALLALPPGAFRPAPKVHSAVDPARVPTAGGRRARTSGCSRRWSGRCSRSGARRWRTR